MKVAIERIFDKGSWFVPYYYASNNKVILKQKDSPVFTKKEFEENCVLLSKYNALYNGETYFVRRKMTDDYQQLFILEKPEFPIIVVMRDKLEKLINGAFVIVPSNIFIYLEQNKDEPKENDFITVAFFNDIIDIKVISVDKQPKVEWFRKGKGNKLFQLYLDYYKKVMDGNVESEFWKPIDKS